MWRLQGFNSLGWPDVVFPAFTRLVPWWSFYCYEAYVYPRDAYWEILFLLFDIEDTIRIINVNKLGTFSILKPLDRGFYVGAVCCGGEMTGDGSWKIGDRIITLLVGRHIFRARTTITLNQTWCWWSPGRLAPLLISIRLEGRVMKTHVVRRFIKGAC